MATMNINGSWSVVRRSILLMALATVAVAASSPSQLETINISNIKTRRRQSTVRGQNHHLTVTDLNSHRALGVGHGGGGGGGKDKPSSKGGRGKHGEGVGKSSGDGHSHGKNEKDGKDSKDDKYDKEEDDYDDDDEGEKGTKLNGGKTNGGGKDGSGKKGGSKSGGGNKKGKKGDHDKPETFRQSVPTFKLSYEIEGPMKRSEPGIGDYNELSVTTEYFFDSFFRSVFEDLPVSLDATIVHIMLEDDEDPFFVDFLVGLDFVVPGEVPTVPFLVDWVEESFERPTSMNSYISDLQAMAETNPFSATKSVSIVRNSPNNAVGFSDGPGGSWKDPRTKTRATESKMFMIGLISGIAFVVFILVGLLWVRQRRFRLVVIENDGKSTSDSDSESDTDELNHLNVKMGSSPKRKDSTQRFSSQEEDTVRYLDSVRRLYNEEEDQQTVKTAFDDVLIPEEEKNRDRGLPSRPSLDEESDRSPQNGRPYRDNDQYCDHDDGRGDGRDDFYDECGSVESYESGSVYEEEIVEEEVDDETLNERGTTASIFRV